MKNYIIIGGSSGIGKELVNLIEQQGDNVFSTYNNNIIEDRPNVKYIKFDATTDKINLDELPEQIHAFA